MITLLIDLIVLVYARNDYRYYKNAGYYKMHQGNSKYHMISEVGGVFGHYLVDILYQLYLADNLCQFIIY